MSNLVKKIFLFITIVLSCLFISNFALANENAMDSTKNGVNHIRNVVGGAENVVENAAKDTTTTVRDGLDNMGNVTQNSMSNMDYSASRTSTNDGSMTTRGSTATATTKNTNNSIWTWFIVGVIALIIIGVIWYMASRNNNSSNR